MIGVRSENYRYNDKDKSYKSQSFNGFKPVYRLNKALDKLEKTDEVVDLQEKINSCKDIALSNVLDRLLPVSQEDDALYLRDCMVDDLDVYTKVVNTANLYKEQLNLDPKLSVSQVFDCVKNESEKLKEVIEKSKKGVEEVEKKIIKESEQA